MKKKGLEKRYAQQEEEKKRYGNQKEKEVNT